MKKQPETGKKMGRPRAFSTAAVAGSLHLPAAFWSVLDEVGGSRSRAFVACLSDDALLAKLTIALEIEIESGA